MVGKWHLGHYTKDYLPQNRGFDNFFGYLSDQLWYYNHKSPHACANGVCFYDMQHNGMNAEDAIGVYSTFLFTDVITQIFEHSDAADPMMMYISWQNVHAPLDPPPMDFFAAAELEVLAKIDDPHRRDFASMTIILDNAMKKIVGDRGARLLRRRDPRRRERQRRLPVLGRVQLPAARREAVPLRGRHPRQRVRALAQPHPRPRARARHYEGMVHVSDRLPTLLYGVADVSPDALDRALDGVDHWKHMVSPELFASADKYPRQEILHNIDLWSLDTQFHNVSLLETPVAGDDAEALSLSQVSLLETPVAALRVGDWKLVMGQDASGWCRAVMRSCAEGAGYCPPTYETTDDCNYRYHQSTYLFNITADPHETTNLAHEFQSVTKKLKERVDYWTGTMVDPRTARPRTRRPTPRGSRTATSSDRSTTDPETRVCARAPRVPRTAPRRAPPARGAPGPRSRAARRNGRLVCLR